MSPFSFISRLIDDEDPVIVMPFGGYGNAEKIFAQARVLEDEGIKHTEEDNFIKNLYNSYKRFESDEVHNATVEISIGTESFSLTSDDEGYIYVDLPHHFALPKDKKTRWLPIDYELKLQDNYSYKITDEIMFPSSEATYGIISDMDETILDTGLTSVFKWRVIVNSFLKHSSKRMPLENVQKFYKALHKGPKGESDNPFFYLSNSPWNLYEYLSDFLKHHELPKGVLLLRDIGFNMIKKAAFQERNKYKKISHILTTYPNLPFILIGDAVDLDHDIYIEIAKQFPNRVKVIYIRTVTDEKKMQYVKQLITAATDIKVILIEHTDEAIAHAKKEELIP